MVVVAPGFSDHLTRYWNVPATKISVVENGVETDLFRLQPAATEIRKQLNLEDRFLICYIGTMGNAHGLETVIAAAEELQTLLPRALFLLIGEGAETVLAAMELTGLVGIATGGTLRNVEPPPAPEPTPIDRSAQPEIELGAFGRFQR